MVNIRISFTVCLLHFICSTPKLKKIFHIFHISPHSLSLYQAFRYRSVCSSFCPKTSRFTFLSTCSHVLLASSVPLSQLSCSSYGTGQFVFAIVCRLRYISRRARLLRSPKLMTVNHEFGEPLDLLHRVYIASQRGFRAQIGS